MHTNPFFCLLAGGALALNVAMAQTTATTSVAPSSASISGTVRSLAPGSPVYFETNVEPVRRLDSARLDNNRRFSFSPNVPAGGGIFVLNLANAQKVALLLEGGETLTVEADGFRLDAKTGQRGKSVVKGSKNMDYYQQLMVLQSDMDKRVETWNKQYQEAVQRNNTKQIAQIEQAVQAAERDIAAKVKGLLPEMGTSLVALFATNYLNPESDFATIDSLARRFERENPSSPQAQSFIGNIARMRGLLIGGEAPDIALSDTTGNVVPLSSLRGKVVLIDFWASWCGPCRAENPNVVRVYNRFKDKGFEIYSVSLDDRRQNWVKAIRNDRLTWTHVSDLKGWRSLAAQQYGVSAIPATFLLDRNGKIIAKNLRGEQLEQKLAEVFQ